MDDPAEVTLIGLRARVREFVAERDWDQFHSPKNLAIALSIEASELLEPFQWLKTGDIAELGNEKLIAVQHEIADVLIYLVRLADKLNIDPISAAFEKIEVNRVKYPAEIVRGDSRKYTDY